MADLRAVLQPILRAEHAVALGGVVGGVHTVFAVEQFFHRVAVAADLQKRHGTGQCAQCLNGIGHTVGKAVRAGLVGIGAACGVILGRYGPCRQPSRLDLGQRLPGTGLVAQLCRAGDDRIDNRRQCQRNSQFFREGGLGPPFPGFAQPCAQSCCQHRFTPVLYI